MSEIVLMKRMSKKHMRYGYSRAAMGTRILSRKRILAIAIIALDVILLTWFAIHMMSSTPSIDANASASLALPQAAKATATINATPELPWLGERINRNGTLSQVFHDLHLSKNDLNGVLSLANAETYLNVLHPGQKLYFQINKSHQLEALKAPLASGKTLYIERAQEVFASRINAPQRITTVNYAAGTINSTLDAAAHKAGLSEGLIAQLSAIFTNKINFNKDVRPGDTFRVLYNQEYQGDTALSQGPIKAAVFINKNHKYTAIQFTYPTNHTGYYTPAGRNLKRLFLKAPLHYNRISSFFSYHRMDPILHRIRPHLGVDFAAPIGTPVHAMSDGVIDYMGKKGGYGNAAVINYGPHYRSLYGHLSRFEPGLHTGSHVYEGETVGFVGDTGWSTGPHLHYSIYFNGRPENPLTFHLPMGSSVPAANLAAFHNHANALLAQLNLHEGPSLVRSAS
jgi:murein DD-endopeptidase MepM/ murein hydrolase activator NlpD